LPLPEYKKLLPLTSHFPLQQDTLSDILIALQQAGWQEAVSHPL
jgi:hypothetical protein